ncbi:MAG: ferric reductase-like transmembrane domain-containing protein [Pseudomonadales bacterium]|nr:ferric reductase-like transmembrane domain-containing protein [Pseudomonadales bacterium]
MTFNRLFWWVWLLLLLSPALWAIYAIYSEAMSPGSMLGGDAGETLVHHFGDWGMRFLLVALLASPLRRLTGSALPLRLRRMTGLAAFSLLSVHVLLYLWFMAGLSWATVVKDIVDRAYITVGFAAWLVLLLLAVTSTRGWQRRLRRRWQQLHRLVYLAALLGIVHLVWATKLGLAEAVFYGGAFLVLMGERVLRSVFKPGPEGKRSMPV